MTLTYAAIEARFVEWARAQPDIHGAVVVGSRARPAPAADAWSDLDVVVFAADPAHYAARRDWLEALGPLWLAVVHLTGRGDPEWLALYEGGLKADFVFTASGPAGAQATLSELMAASPYRFVYQAGVRPLFDRPTPPGVVPKAIAPDDGPAQRGEPEAQAFEAHWSQVWLAAVNAARFLRRGEVWRAQQVIERDLKARLLEALVWEARTAQPPRAAWDDGRRLAEWAEPAALAALPETVGGYSVAEQWRALNSTLAVWGRLARAVAQRIGAAYPEAAEAQLRAWLDSAAPAP